MAFVIASQILLWIAIIVLAAVATALSREVARLKGRLADAGPLQPPLKPARAGEPAPRLSLTDLAGRAVEIGAPPPGRSQLIFYLSPDCPVCKSLLPTLTAAAASQVAWLDVILASEDMGPQHRAYVAAWGLGQLPYVVSDRLGEGLGVAKLPHATLIDSRGVIAAMAQVNDPAELESVVAAGSTGVASLQAFLAKRPAGRGAPGG